MQQVFFEYIGYFFLGLLGLVSHFLKQKIKGQTIQSIKSWFFAHPKDAILSLIAFIVSFLVLVQTNEMNYLTVFMSGYMCDSLFSRKDTGGSA